MTTEVDIVNRALQAFGSRSTVTALELANNSSNEAIQANLIRNRIRDQLLRMAPWDCAMFAQNLVYITSQPGTPENTSPATALWERGQPIPPWAYEYQYPVDCLRACRIIPATQTGFASGVPITTAVTGGAAAFWQGPPVMFKVMTDEFVPVTAAAVASGGSGYAVGDIITLEGTTQGDPPKGAPVKLRVLTAPAGVVGTVEVVNQIQGEASPHGGSYFEEQTNPVAQGETTGSGTGATFNLTFGDPGLQRVIVTNQEFATLVYCKQVENPNVMDPLFQEAWTQALGCSLVIPLAGDKAMIKICEKRVNDAIMEARKADGNEGLTVNDVTPDFIRIRGVTYTEGYSSPYSQGFEWGPLWSFM